MEQPQLQIMLPEEYEKQIFYKFYQLAEDAIKRATENVVINDKYLSQEQVCRYLRCGVGTVDEMVANGLKFSRIGRKKMFSKKDIEDYIESQKN